MTAGDESGHVQGGADLTAAAGPLENLIRRSSWCKRPRCRLGSWEGQLEPVDHPLIELGPAASAGDVLHRYGGGLLLAHQNDQTLVARDSGVKKVALEHGIVLRQHRDDHGGVFGALALVDRRRIGGTSMSNSPKP